MTGSVEVNNVTKLANGNYAVYVTAKNKDGTSQTGAVELTSEQFEKLKLQQQPQFDKFKRNDITFETSGAETSQSEKKKSYTGWIIAGSVVAIGAVCAIFHEPLGINKLYKKIFKSRKDIAEIKLPERVLASLPDLLDGKMTSGNFQSLMLDSGCSADDMHYFFSSTIASLGKYSAKENILDLAKQGKFDIKEENLWVLYQNDIFRKFLNSGDEKGIMLKRLLQANNLYSERYNNFEHSLNHLISSNEESSCFQDVFDKFKELYNIDLIKPPKIYRFIEAKELESLLAGESIQPRFYRDGKTLDVTIDPELDFHSYRITYNYNFKDKKISNNKPEDYYYHSEGPYSLEDISAIDSVMPEGYLRIKTVKTD